MATDTDARYRGNSVENLKEISFLNFGVQVTNKEKPLDVPSSLVASL